MPNITMSVSPSQVDMLVSGQVSPPIRTDFSFNFTFPKPPKGIMIPRFDLSQSSAAMESINSVLENIKIALPLFAATAS